MEAIGPNEQGARRLEVDTQTAPEFQGDLPIGFRLKGRFVLESVLGSGGMGVVYKALDERAVEAKYRQPYVALKVLKPDLGNDERLRMALQRECKRSQELPHPNIITVYDFDRDGAYVFLTMEYLEGTTLEKFVEQHREGVAIDEAWPWIKAMGEALQFAHRNGIVHSDFKPANVFMTKLGRIKVMDFGVAKRVQMPTDLTGNKQTTVFGGLRGFAPSYATPEVLGGQDAGFSDDVFAFACTVYELLTGTHPYAFVPSVQAKELGLKARRPVSLDRRQWNALQRGLSFAAEHRGSSVEDLVQELEPPRKMRMGIAPMMVGGGVALAAAIGGGVWWFSQQQSQTAANGAGESRPITANTGQTKRSRRDEPPPIEVVDEDESPASPEKSLRKTPTNEQPPAEGKNAGTESTPEASRLQPMRPATESLVEPQALEDEVVYRLGKHRTISLDADLAVGLDKKQFRVGEKFELSFATSTYPYVYIVTVNPASEVDQVYPNDYQPDRPVETNQAYRVPPKEAANFVLEIDKPFGRHRVVVVASRQPVANPAAELAQKSSAKVAGQSRVEIGIDVTP